MPRGKKRNRQSQRNRHLQSDESTTSRRMREGVPQVGYKWRSRGPVFPVKSYVDPSIVEESRES